MRNRRSPESISSRSRSAGDRIWVRWAPLFLLWLIAFALRLVLSQTDRVVWGDEPFYLWLGRNWITGQGYSFVGHPDVHHGPLFPWMAGLLYILTHDMALSSEILYMTCGSLLVLPIYAMGTKLYGRRVGLYSAALTAVFPALTASVLHWGTMTEPAYMLFLYLGLWAGLVILRPLWRTEGAKSSSEASADPWWPYVTAGAAFGLAYLTRPEAVGYFVLVGGLVVLVRGWQRRPGATRFWIGLLLYVTAFGLAFAPYAYYVRQHTGAWMVSEKVGVAYLTGMGLARGDTTAFDRATWGLDSTGLETFFFSSESYNISMIGLVLADPATFARIVYMNAQRFVQVSIDWSLFPHILLPLVVLGLFDRGWTRERALKEIYLFGSTLPVLSFVLFYIQPRYLVPAAPVLILWAARGLARFRMWLIGTVTELRTPTKAAEVSEGQPYGHLPKLWPTVFGNGPLLVVMAALLLIHPHVIRQVTDVGSVRPEHKTVGEHLHRIVPRDAVIMSRYPAIAFHAGASWVPTPNASWPQVLEYARHKDVGYFVIDERELRYRPQFKGLVTAEHPPPELELVYVDASSGERLVVYEVTG